MQIFQNKKFTQKFYKTNLFFILVLIFLVFLTRATYSVYKKENISREILEEKKEEFEALAGREELLEEEIKKLNTERGVEEEIREKFSFVKGDERLIILLDSKPTTTDSDEGNAGNIFQRFFDWIF